MNTNILSFNKCKLDTMWPINKCMSRENICTLLFIISLKKNIFCSSHIKIAYTKKYITKKLINQFLDQVEYPI